MSDEDKLSKGNVTHNYSSNRGGGSFSPILMLYYRQMTEHPALLPR
jgi:hypothetical protein